MIKPLKAIIADDEYLICDSLQEILLSLDIEILEICHDGLDALEAIEEHNPDVAFLDIRMPGLDGIEIASKLSDKEKAPIIIFISAYDDYALKAYKVNALDYIVKPFVKEDIQKVIEKIKRLTTKTVQLMVDSRMENKLTEAAVYPLQIGVYRDTRTAIIQADTIVYAYAEDRGVFVLTLDGTIYSVRSRLSELEEKLDPKHFFRCHRKYLVNMRHAKEIAPGFNRGYILTLKGEKKAEAQVSRAKINQLSKYVYF